MSSGEIPKEVIPPTTTYTHLHSFVKLAIAYIGILLGLTVISAAFAASSDFDLGYSYQLGLRIDKPYVMAYYAVLMPLMVVTIELLRRNRRLGAYLAFAALAIHYSIYYPFVLFAITSTIVGVLLVVPIRRMR